MSKVATDASSAGPLLIVSFLVLLLATACGANRTALPSNLADTAEPLAASGVRAWGDRRSPVFQDDFVESLKQSRKARARGWVDKTGAVNILSLSGGGSNALLEPVS